MRGFESFIISFVLTSAFLMFVIFSNGAEAKDIRVDLSADFQTISTEDYWKLINFTCKLTEPDDEKAHTDCVVKVIEITKPIPSRSI